MMEEYSNVYICKSRATPILLTKLRDKDTQMECFIHYAKRLMRLLSEEGISFLPTMKAEVQTPTGLPAEGVEVDDTSVCAVSIIRSGDALLESVRECLPSVKVGKILIQRDESSEEKVPIVYYNKLPPDIASMDVLLVDPMLATGGSAISAVQILINAGVSEERIIFLNVISCPEGIEALLTAHPGIKIVTCVVDQGLNEDKYIVPGLGDYGDRYFGTI
mmetsp:Transcript_8929/g.11838  ORF Transcript_8929/g.11838 Transcript_8929/m.11838 type:complete len:219 (+) Transcript_8929:202-858(+)